MGKRWIWLLIVLSVLLLAFLFPRIMLLIMEKDMEDHVLTYGTGTLLNFDAMTMGAKQSLLSDPDVTIIREVLSPPDAEEKKTTISLELQHLADCGAISITAYDALSNSLQDGEVWSCKAYDPNGKNVFYFYSLEGNRSYIKLDHESEKILSIGAYIVGDPDFTEESCEIRLRSWAEYYGMSVSDLVAYSHEASTDTAGSHATCKLSGSGNSSCYYSVSVDPDRNYLECGSVLLPPTASTPQ